MASALQGLRCQRTYGYEEARGLRGVVGDVLADRHACRVGFFQGLCTCREACAAYQSLNINRSLHFPFQTGVLFETLQAISATVRSATCNTFSSQDHAEAGFAKAGTAQFSHGQELSLAKHKIPGHMACREEFGPVQPFKSLNLQRFFSSSHPDWDIRWRSRCATAMCSVDSECIQASSVRGVRSGF